jgi:hypothetical protein
LRADIAMFAGVDQSRPSGEGIKYRVNFWSVFAKRFEDRRVRRSINFFIFSFSLRGGFGAKGKYFTDLRARDLMIKRIFSHAKVGPLGSGVITATYDY